MAKFRLHAKFKKLRFMWPNGIDIEFLFGMHKVRPGNRTMGIVHPKHMVLIPG
jgi:hypothetical protein